MAQFAEALDAERIRTALLVAVLLLAIVTLLLLRRPRAPRPRAIARRWGLRPGEPVPRAGVVVHGSKIDDADARREQIDSGCRRAGWATPLWWETTTEDPGRSQTAAAVQEQVSTVLAFGGDGTARVVAGALAGGTVPMGLLPAGTGNLLARNLGIPHGRLDEALQIALGGRLRRLDVGRAQLDEQQPAESFLVMAGLGFDAEVMAAAGRALKQRLGWGAYVVTGLQRLRGRRTPVTITVDDDPPRHRRVRAVVVGNCGMLQGGVQLMPGAQPDDGWLDVIVVTPRTLAGWLAVTGSVLTGRPGGQVEYLRCRRIEIRAERPMAAQLDGDPAGTSQLLRAHLEPGALQVRVAR